MWDALLCFLIIAWFVFQVYEVGSRTLGKLARDETQEKPGIRYKDLRIDTEDLDPVRTVACGSGGAVTTRSQQHLSAGSSSSQHPPPRSARSKRSGVGTPLQEPGTPRLPVWYESLETELRRLQHLQKLADETRANSINALASMDEELEQIRGTVEAHREYFSRVDECRGVLLKQTKDQLDTTISLQMQQQDILSRMVGAVHPAPTTRCTSAATTPRGSICTTPSEPDLLPPTPQDLDTPQHIPTRIRRVPSRGGTPRARKWKKGGVIGSGAFGTVHIAMDEGGKMVAVKNIPFDVHESPGAINGKLSSLKNEIELMRGLEHPNIVRYISAEREGGSLNIVMEYVSGGSIASLLKVFGPLAECVAVAYTYQVLNGLQYLHSRGVIHRDIKGANILLTVDGVCKLSDFGAATYIVASDVHTSFVGTPLWMPPEVIRQEGHTETADVWSLGCTVMEMLSGIPPWDHVCTTPMSALNYITGESDIKRDIRDAVEGLCCEAGVQFIMSCVVRDPEKRLGTQELAKHEWLSSVEGDCDDAEGDATIWKTAVQETNAKLCETLGPEAGGAAVPETPRTLSISPDPACALRVTIQRAPGFRKSVSPDQNTPVKSDTEDQVLPEEGTPPGLSNGMCCVENIW